MFNIDTFVPCILLVVVLFQVADDVGDYFATEYQLRHCSHQCQVPRTSASLLVKFSSNMANLKRGELLFHASYVKPYIYDVMYPCASFRLQIRKVKIHVLTKSYLIISNI